MVAPLIQSAAMSLRWIASCLIALSFAAPGSAAMATEYKHKKTTASKRKAPAAVRRVAADNGELNLRSNVVLVMDQANGQPVISKNVDEVHPIASITKLMTAMVILDAQVPMEERVTIGEADRDTERNSSSRLRMGAELTRTELLQLALMASENRAAHALGRTFPGGMPAFVQQMNLKAKALGMTSSRFVDPTGLSSGNVSTAQDLVKMVRAADRYAVIRDYSTASSREIEVLGRPTRFANTNRLVGSDAWDISLSKTGFINEAGRCLVMQAKIQGRPLTIVLLDSAGRLTRIGDANRIRKWLTTQAGAQRRLGGGSGEAAGG
jgi:D-alanyl-D-alanine endopeptidase (penicillin-binding protein 7)